MLHVLVFYNMRNKTAGAVAAAAAASGLDAENKGPSTASPIKLLGPARSTRASQ
jgi:hypothetical protein